MMLGVRIRLLRESRGWSQAVLAQALHVSPSAIGMYEQNRREPGIDMLVRLSREFGVSLDFLITGCAGPDTGVVIQCPFRK